MEIQKTITIKDGDDNVLVGRVRIRYTGEMHAWPKWLPFELATRRGMMEDLQRRLGNILRLMTHTLGLDSKGEIPTTEQSLHYLDPSNANEIVKFVMAWCCILEYDLIDVLKRPLTDDETATLENSATNAACVKMYIPIDANIDKFSLPKLPLKTRFEGFDCESFEFRGRNVMPIGFPLRDRDDLPPNANEMLAVVAFILMNKDDVVHRGPDRFQHSDFNELVTYLATALALLSERTFSRAVTRLCGIWFFHSFGQDFEAYNDCTREFARMAKIAEDKRAS